MLLRKYTKKLVKLYKKESINRCQLNFACDVGLVSRLKSLAHYLDTPFYPLAEHALEMGISEIAVIIQDEALTENLQRHLLQGHLLVKNLDPVERHMSDRATRIDNVLKLLALIETRAGSPQAVQHIIERLTK